MAIFWWLLALTIAEVGLGYMPAAGGAARTAKVCGLVVMAVVKAALVAMYFMHLRFEKKTLALIAGIPIALCVFLMLMLVPDADRRGNVQSQVTGPVLPAGSAPAPAPASAGADEAAPAAEGGAAQEPAPEH
jgi:caa(3)-type oxidase subunit IV